MPVFDLIGPTFNPRDSYGKIMTELAAALDVLGIGVNAHGVHVVHPAHTPRQARLLSRPHRPAQASIAFAYPTNIHKMDADAVKHPRIAVTMFESTKLPDGWADVLNSWDAVIVPSRWLVDVFKDNGVTVPITVVPLGISAAFQYVERSVDQTPFTFLGVGDAGLRKGYQTSVFAFHKAFGDDPAYKLVIKCRSEIVLKITSANVEYLCADMDERALAQLIGQAHCFVYPARGEGFGFWPRQAAATGCPVIATHWGGLADDIGQWGFPLRYTMEPAWEDNRLHYHLGEWANPDIDHLAELMRYVADHRESTLTVARDAAANIRRLYDWNQFAAGVVNVYEQIAEKVAV